MQNIVFSNPFCIFAYCNEDYSHALPDSKSFNCG